MNTIDTLNTNYSFVQIQIVNKYVSNVGNWIGSPVNQRKYLTMKYEDLETSVNL